MVGFGFAIGIMLALVVSVNGSHYDIELNDSI